MASAVGSDSRSGERSWAPVARVASTRRASTRVAVCWSLGDLVMVGRWATTAVDRFERSRQRSPGPWPPACLE